MKDIVPIIIIAIIALQFFFFIRNLKRMQEYKDVFKNQFTWDISFNEETKFVSGIKGEGNTIFVSIKNSINKYLGNNSGSVIDFNLLKDAVDRHCDTVENDVNTLTPVPLYCGLAGTMAGVIIGLFSFLNQGTIGKILQTGDNSLKAAQTGVDALLSGVAWAMAASIFGIILTTTSSILFKKYKLEGESGKNSFIAWLQSKLLPELPNDTTQTISKLVKNLNRFNNTFTTNIATLKKTFEDVNKSYQIQANVIKYVHDMDVMKMANANIKVLTELQNCTDQLAEFNEYLNSIHGYTDAIHTFTTRFEQESNRLYVLEEIQRFFTQHKEEIAKETADADLALKSALDSITNNTLENSTELNNILVTQAEEFKRIIREEKEAFERLINEISIAFEREIRQIPNIQDKLAEVSDIPSKLEILISKIQQSNKTLSDSVSATMKKTAREIANGQSGNSHLGFMPKWLKWTIVISIITIAIYCLYNLSFDAYERFKSYFWESSEDSTMVEEVVDTTDVDSAIINIINNNNSSKDSNNISTHNLLHN